MSHAPDQWNRELGAWDKEIGSLHIHAEHLLELRGVVRNSSGQGTRGVVLIIEKGNWFLENTFEILLSIRT